MKLRTLALGIAILGLTSGGVVAYYHERDSQVDMSPEASSEAATESTGVSTVGTDTTDTDTSDDVIGG